MKGPPEKFPNLHRKKIYCLCAPGDWQELGGMLHEAGAETIPYNEPILWLDGAPLLPEVQSAALQRIRGEKPDAVVIYHPGLNGEHRHEALASLMPLLTDLRHEKIRTLLVEEKMPLWKTHQLIERTGANTFYAPSVDYMLCELNAVLGPGRLKGL